MKNLTYIPSAGAGERIAAADASTSPAPTSPPGAGHFHLACTGQAELDQTTLLALGTLYVEREMDRMLGEPDEARIAQGVQAGIITTLHALLAPAQFRAVLIQWEVDAIRLTELLHIAGSSATTGQHSETEIIQA